MECSYYHGGRDLKLDEAAEVLKTIEQLWRAPVQLLTAEGEDEGSTIPPPAPRLTSLWPSRLLPLLLAALPQQPLQLGLSLRRQVEGRGLIHANSKGVKGLIFVFHLKMAY